jgi:hypothetical protein
LILAAPYPQTPRAEIVTNFQRTKILSPSFLALGGSVSSMRAFWYNGGLQIIPESKKESELLCSLTDAINLEKPLGMRDCIPRGDCQSGDGLFELIVGNKETRPSSNSRKLDHKKQVICIDELL